MDPVDDWLTRRLRKACKDYQIELTILDSPLFLNSNQDLSIFFKPERKKFFQTEFYKKERIRHKLLLDEHGGPLGGQWTYDTENRKKYPKGKQTPSIQWPTKNAVQQEAMIYVQTHFPQAIGTANELINYPTDHESSTLWLRNFLAQRLSEFGDYEDAILQHENLLHHSLLTPMLNVGLLTPKQVLEETLRYSQTHQVPLNSLEGFIRQIIGWREFIRGVYVSKGREERVNNFWGFTRRLPDSFYTGHTGILPVDRTIQKVLQTSYCHHIERLMILGNFMLLCEFHPDEVYRWFMEHFIDAYDWVMVPNVYGMSQFADGGLMSTKPYISGSNYLMKMSDYPKGDWQECWDALFWRFLHRHRAFFLQHPRLGMLVKTFDKWDAAKRETLLLRAENYLQTLD